LTPDRKTGTVTSLLIVPLLFIVLYEVVMRYAFNAPTTWGFEATTFAYGMHYMLGLSYMENVQGHVRVDIFTSRMNVKAQACDRSPVICSFSCRFTD
jgi:TRAP-type mannitol/chloroaromatic compound transport system permease small subunit